MLAKPAAHARPTKRTWLERAAAVHEIASTHLASATHGGTLRSMFDVASHGGSVDRPAGGFPLRSILSGVALGCALLWAMCWCAGARAGTLYQCTGASGEVAYSSSKVGYHGCRAISSYAAPAPRRQAPPLRVSSLSAVTGSVATTARNLGADGAEPTSLANVQGSVETSARGLGEAKVQRTSLAAVQGAVETTAKPPLAAAITGTPGHWSYHESRGAEAPLAAVADAPDTRVLRGAVYRIVQADGSV
jgi:hypothetical protein